MNIEATSMFDILGRHPQEQDEFIAVENKMKKEKSLPFSAKRNAAEVQLKDSFIALIVDS